MTELSTHSKYNGFSLVEITIAIGIIAFCLVLVLGLIPMGLNANRESIRESVAANLANAIVTDLRVTASNLGSPLYSIHFPLSGSTNMTSLFLNDAGAPSPVATSTFRATVIIGNPPSGRGASFARLLISWPGAVDANTNSLPQKYSGSWETVVGLDRN